MKQKEEKQVVVVSEDDSQIDNILSMVSTEPLKYSFLSKKETKQEIVKINNKCWHLEGCENIAVKKLTLKPACVALGQRLVHSQKSNKDINLLCSKHFNSSEYDWQKRFSTIESV